MAAGLTFRNNEMCIRDRGIDVQSLDFPFPKSMVDDEGYYYGDITVTLAVDPVSVSYTHLDVYKRQTLSILSLWIS